MKIAFKLGRLVITSNADDVLTREDVFIALLRHATCDWGESKDKELNDAAVENNNDRILSVYRDSKGTKFWIITEADRSATTILLPDDY
jgi:hypothetical protein